MSRVSEVETLEHESGLRPLGEYPSHCADCRSVHATRERQRHCPHESVDEFRTFAGAARRRCADCDAPLNP